MLLDMTMPTLRDADTLRPCVVPAIVGEVQLRGAKPRELGLHREEPEEPEVPPVRSEGHLRPMRRGALPPLLPPLVPHPLGQRDHQPIDLRSEPPARKWMLRACVTCVMSFVAIML